MMYKQLFGAAAIAALATLTNTPWGVTPVYAQDQAAASTDDSTPAPLSEDELEILVARIALYPDELVAVISGAALYPLQVVEAARYLDNYAKDKTLKPKTTWDGSVISLLNYPEIVKMMSEDLEWTQQFGDALAYQQKDLLIAIQQLRDEAVAKGVIKSDDKVQVVQENDNVVIKSANPEVIYVPRYEPEMLYVDDYPYTPVSYYPDPYPSYYYPTAPFFAAAVTGVVWAAAVDWDDWGVWGGRWNGGDIDIDCDHCFNNINGKVNFQNVDWKNVDRSKINISKDQIAKLDRTNIKNKIQRNNDNSIRRRASELKKNRPETRPGKISGSSDIRKSTLEGLKNKNPGGLANARPDIKKPVNRPDIKKPANRPDISRPNAGRPNKIDRPVSRPKPAGRPDVRPSRPSGLGNVDRGKVAKVNANRGAKSMGGGMRGGGARAPHPRGGGGRRR